MRVFGDIARLGAKRHPDKHAVVKDDAFLTFGQLNSRANQLANGLLALGVRPGDRIAILSQNCLEFVVVASGVAKCGAVLVPVNFRYKKTELVYLTQNCKPKLLFFSPDFKPLIADVVNEISPSIRLATLFGTPLIPGLDLDGIMAGQAASEPAVSVDPDSALMITYTSGTTGTPKGVLSSHRATLNNYLGMVVEGDLQPTDITLVNLPLFHTGGMHALLQPTLFRGGTAVIMAGQFDPDRVLDTVSRHRVTLTMWVPTMLAMLTQHPNAAAYDVRTLAKIWYGSSAITPTVLEAAMDLFKCRFYQWYGQAETGMVSVLRPEDHTDHSQYTGREMFNADLRIVDEDGEDVPEGEVGEIISARENLGMIGYHHLEANQRSSIENGWIHTGDLARVEGDGFFTVVDRMGDMIISGAENIYPKEIEDVISRHPGVREVAVIGIPDAIYGESVCAVVVCKDECTIEPQEVIDFCASRIAGYKKPKRVDFVESLPKNASGKVVKNVVRETYWVGHEKRV